MAIPIPLFKHHITINFIDGTSTSYDNVEFYSASRDGLMMEWEFNPEDLGTVLKKYIPAWRIKDVEIERVR